MYWCVCACLQCINHFLILDLNKTWRPGVIALQGWAQPSLSSCSHLQSLRKPPLYTDWFTSKFLHKASGLRAGCALSGDLHTYDPLIAISTCWWHLAAKATTSPSLQPTLVVYQLHLPMIDQIPCQITCFCMSSIQCTFASTCGSQDSVPNPLQVALPVKTKEVCAAKIDATGKFCVLVLLCCTCPNASKS